MSSLVPLLSEASEFGTPTYQVQDFINMSSHLHHGHQNDGVWHLKYLPFA